MVRCNICGGWFFSDMNMRRKVLCRKCGSLERTRLLWLYLQGMDLSKDARILHVAPEKGLAKKLAKRVSNGNYIPADIDPSRYSYVKHCIPIDLCDLDDWPSHDFDLILHSHVLEHTPCDIAYTLYHLHRMLKPNGHHVCVIPFLSGRYDESFDDIGDSERKRRFGQFDHVRRFGRENIPEHLGKLLNLPENFDATEHFPESVLRKANIPEDHWKGFHIGTVLILKRDDMTLLREGAGGEPTPPP